MDARFSVGEVVHHRLFDYRGVVYDVDSEFCGTEEWYEAVARSRPPKDRPWYKVLVDGGRHATYVAERHLEAVADPGPIRHPAIGELFARFEDGVYVPRASVH